LRDEYARIAKHNTEVIFINPESVERVQDYIAKAKLTREDIPFPVVADPDRAFVKAYRLEKLTEKQVEVFPSMFLIDRNGVLRFKYIGTEPFDRPSADYLEEILAGVNGT
jgi:peroxiredoxin